MINLASSASDKDLVTAVENYIPHSPSERQLLFLVDLHDESEAFYGGAAGGGKSDALLMAALEYVHVPNYAALLLRKTYQDLAKPGALMDRAIEWLNPFVKAGKVKWSSTDKRFRFPSGAVLDFGYLENENDKLQYQSAEYQFIGFDELSQFSETQYTYMFSRRRRPIIPCDNCLKPLTKDKSVWVHTNDSDCTQVKPNVESVRRNGALYDIPLRTRAGSNPAEDLRGYWVAERFVPDDFTPEDAIKPCIFWKEGKDAEGQVIKRPFVPSRIEDNPYLDQKSYDKGLRELDDVTYEQLRHGDWQIRKKGNIFPYDEQYHVISWSQFEKVFGVRGIPAHWKCGIAQDWGTTKSHPCVTTLFTTSAKNSLLPDHVFIPWGLCLYDAEDAQQVGSDYLIPQLESMGVRERIERWWISHERTSEMNSYRKMGLPFNKWGMDSNGGIDQVRRYLRIRNKNKPNPFGKTDRLGNLLYGCPMLMLVVDDDQLINAKNDKGLARWRAEFQSYSWHIPKAGDAPEKLRPQKLFNDAMDTVRCYAELEFPRAVDLTREEQIERLIPAHLKPDAIKEITEKRKRDIADQAYYQAYYNAKRQLDRQPQRSQGVYQDIRNKYAV